jgi:hypothetical protein
VAIAASPAVLAQAAGRVVLAVGDVTQTRGTERQRIAAGAAVNVGDAVATGTQSHAQLRFSDEALVALKPDSEFRIEQFAYAGRIDGGERAVFRLVRGGFRTLTGSIGHVNQDTYQVQTTQATIGIRGTHYALQICALDQCRESATGPASPPGLYGGVFDGRIAVANALGQAEFGAREFFFVPDGEAPRRLVAPPLFLADRLEGRTLLARSAPAELTFPKVPALAQDLVLPVPPFTYVAGEDLRSGSAGAPPVAEGDLSIVVGSDRYTLELDATPHAQLTRNGAGALTGFANGALSAALGGAQLADVGSDIAGGARVNWGRWNGPGSAIVQQFPDGTSATNNGGNLHYIYGTLATDLPGSGQVFYAPVGGTRPTDSVSGAAGTLVSGGSIGVDFTAARLTLSGLAVGFSDANYTMSGSATINGGLFSTSPLGATVGCTGAACRPLQAGNFAGFLAGPGGAGIGLDYFFNVPGGVIEGVSGYRKCPGTQRC